MAQQKKVRPTGAAFVSNKHVYFISALHMRPFRELYMYLCVAQQGGEGRDEVEHSPRTSFGTPIATNSTWKMRSRKVSAVALYDWDFGGTNVPLPLPLPFQHFRPFFLLLFFRLVTTQREGLTPPLLLPLTCCRHHYKQIVRERYISTPCRQWRNDRHFRPLECGYCGLFDFKILCRNLNNCFTRCNIHTREQNKLCFLPHLSTNSDEI